MSTNLYPPKIQADFRCLRIRAARKHPLTVQWLEKLMHSRGFCLVTDLVAFCVSKAEPVTHFLWMLNHASRRSRGLSIDGMPVVPSARTTVEESNRADDIDSTSRAMMVSSSEPGVRAERSSAAVALPARRTAASLKSSHLLFYCNACPLYRFEGSVTAWKPAAKRSPAPLTSAAEDPLRCLDEDRRCGSSAAADECSENTLLVGRCC